MRYDLIIDGRPAGQFASTEEASARAREALRRNADCEIELRDAATGKPVEPASSKNWREQLASRVGF